MKNESILLLYASVSKTVVNIMIWVINTEFQMLLLNESNCYRKASIVQL